jgi:hypothetical protein
MSDLNNLIDDDEDAGVPALKPRSKAKAKATAPKGEKMVTIHLEENENIPPTGQFIQYGAGHALRTFMLRPGEDVAVPEAILHILDQAVQDVPQIDPTTKQVVGYRKKLRFPYRVVREAQAA